MEADVDAFGVTHPGRVRRSNEDQFLIASLHKLLRVQQSSLPEQEYPQLVSDPRGYLFLVADGVGGRPDGHLASETVLRTIADHVTNLMDLYRRLDPERESLFLRELTASVERSHAILKEQGEREHDGRGLATTLTMVAVLWPRAYLVQVGDSRCYRLRDGRLARLSRDQTVAQALVDSGALTPEEATRSPFRSVLASAVGGPEALPITASDDVRRNDVMLLCTDGLTKHVSEAEIEQELQRLEAAEQSCHRLVDLALERGGGDNITVLIGRMRPRNSRASGARASAPGG
jgi:protein phosphatase